MYIFYVTYLLSIKKKSKNLHTIFFLFFFLLFHIHSFIYIYTVYMFVYVIYIKNTLYNEERRLGVQRGSDTLVVPLITSNDGLSIAY